MNELWNKKQLEPPPTNTSSVKIQITDVQILHQVTTDFINICNLQTLDEEAAILSRIIYRMKHKFRNDKGFHYMEKINHGLLQYLNMNYKQSLETFVNTIDLNTEQNCETYLPTKQMLEYLLVRTQGFAKLMCRISGSCKITAEYMNSRIRSGQSWPLALLVLSLSSRIYISSCFLIYNSCSFFDKMVLYLKTLKPQGVRWLPENYSFPTDLFLWLDIKLTDYHTLVKAKSSKDNPFDLIENSFKAVHVESSISNKGVDDRTICNSTCEIDLKAQLTDSVDLGTVITRKSFEKLVNNELTKRDKKSKLKEKKGVKCHSQVKKKRKHQIRNIKDVPTLEEFIKKENKYRKLSSVKSLTKHLNSLQWKLIQKLIKKLIKKIQPNMEQQKRKIIKKVKKILTNNIQIDTSE